VPQSVARVLGVREQSNQSVNPMLVNHLRSKHLLLVLGRENINEGLRGVSNRF
jgi:hypothetical protein